MEGLFDKDPMFLHPRDTQGRFCTLERAQYEKAKSENRLLRMQVDKYKRQAEVVVRENMRMKRELERLHDAIRSFGAIIKKN